MRTRLVYPAGMDADTARGAVPREHFIPSPEEERAAVSFWKVQRKAERILARRPAPKRFSGFSSHYKTNLKVIEDRIGPRQ